MPSAECDPFENEHSDGDDPAFTRHSVLGTRHFRVRAFERREIASALAWAREGGIALHFFRWSHPRYGTGEYCHVLCADRERLIAFGARFGWVPAVLQPPRRGRGVWHYDAYGWRTLALRRLAASSTIGNAEGAENAENAEENPLWRLCT